MVKNIEEMLESYKEYEKNAPNVKKKPFQKEKKSRIV